MSTTRRISGRRLVAVAISCTALTAVTLGSAFAARNQPGATASASSGWAGLVRFRLLVAETSGADADELDVLNGLIDPDDLDEVDSPETETSATETETSETETETSETETETSETETETSETETSETETETSETPEAANDDEQGEVDDDQGENEQDEADAAEHDDGGAAEHDDGDSGEHEDGESDGD